MKFANVSVGNFENAIRGMRNPLESWDKSDSGPSWFPVWRIGEKDLELAQKLLKSPEQRKFLRQIFHP